MNMTGCYHYGQEGHFIRDCPQLVAVETSEVGTVALPQATTVLVRLVGVVQAEVAV